MWKVNYKNLKIFSVSATSGSSNVTLTYGFLSHYLQNTVVTFCTTFVTHVLSCLVLLTLEEHTYFP